MGISYSHGARRRRVIVASPPPPPPPVVAPSRPAIVVVSRPGRPRPAAVVSIRRKITPADRKSDPRPRVSHYVPPIVRVVRSPQRAVLVRPQQLDAPPPPSPIQYPRQVVVVNSMATRYQHGNRRRRIVIVGTNATPSPGVASSARSRVVVANRPPGRKLPYEFYVRVEGTTRVSSGLPAPPPGGGGSPRPMQPTWITGTLRARSPKLPPPVIVVKTWYKAPTKDGSPNQLVVVDPPRPRRSPPGIIVHPTFKWGLNAGKAPNPPVIVARPVPRKSPKAVVVHSPAVQGKGFRPPRPAVVVPSRRRTNLAATGAVTFRPRVVHLPTPAPHPIVAPRFVVRRGANAILQATDFIASTQRAPHQGRPVVVGRPAPVKRLRGLVAILPFDAFELVPPQVVQPIVVPSRLGGGKAARTAIVVSLKPGVNPRAIPAFNPTLVPILRGRKPAPWVFTSQFLKFTLPPPRHEPLPRTTFVRIPRRRSPLLWPQPQVRTSILQPDDQRFDMPPDLIAACIAWLRANPAIVAAFGDDAKSSTSLKFTSDVEPPGTNLPYAVFNEPQEVESYETADHTGRPSSTAAGVFHLAVFASEKLAVRNLAESLAASLNDAPLVFLDGVLIYLRRSERRFPTVTAPGPMANVTMFKRVLEFEYLIERYI